MGADRDEDGVELTRFLFGENIVDFVIDDYLDAHALNLADLFHQIFARQPVRGNAEMQHAAGQRSCLVDLHLMAKPRQMIGSRETTRLPIIWRGLAMRWRSTRQDRCPAACCISAFPRTGCRAKI